MIFGKKNVNFGPFFEGIFANPFVSRSEALYSHNVTIFRYTFAAAICIKFNAYALIEVLCRRLIQNMPMPWNGNHFVTLTRHWKLLPMRSRNNL